MKISSLYWQLLPTKLIYHLTIVNHLCFPTSNFLCLHLIFSIIFHEAEYYLIIRPTVWQLLKKIELLKIFKSQILPVFLKSVGTLLTNFAKKLCLHFFLVPFYSFFCLIETNMVWMQSYFISSLQKKDLSVASQNQNQKWYCKILYPFHLHQSYDCSSSGSWGFLKLEFAVFTLLYIL